MAPRPAFLANPLAQFALGAFALVVGAALLFGLIGLVSDGGSPVVEDTPLAQDTTAATEATTSPPTTGGETTDTATTPDDATTAPTTDEPTTPAETEPAGQESPPVPPGEVDLQVLDAVSASSSNHEAVMACLRDAGYETLISNRASREYQETTVFWTAGGDNEAIARHVASVIGATVVEEKPSNLSDTVNAHVVVGVDATSPC